MSNISEEEWELRVRRFVQLRNQVDDGLDDAIASTTERRLASRHGALEIVDRFLTTRDATDLKQSLDGWRNFGTTKHWGFGGPNGQMFLNQLVNDSDPAEIGGLLARCFEPPADEDAAAQRLEELRTHVAKIRAGGSSAQEGRVAQFLSWFWWLRDPSEWPVAWTSVWEVLIQLGFIKRTSGEWSPYFDYVEHVERFGGLPLVEQVCDRVGQSQPYGLDITTPDRLAFVDEHRTLADTDEANFAKAKVHLELLREMVRPFSKAAATRLEALFGATVKTNRPSIWWQSSQNRLRRNLYVSWTPDTEWPSPSLLLVADAKQIQVGLQSSSARAGKEGLLRATFELLEHDPPEGTDWMLMAGSLKDPDRDLSEIPVWSVLGRSFTFDQFATHDDAIAQVVETAQSLMPAFEKVWALDRDNEAAPVPTVETAPSDGDSLASLVEQFITQEGYPNERDRRDRAARKEWAPLLQRSTIASTPLAELRRMYNGSSFGSPGPQSILNTTLADEDPDTVDRFRQAIAHLLWGPGTDGERIDDVMDESRYGLRGFKEGAIMKFLAIAHPDRFLAVYPFTGTQGKAAMLQALGLDVPDMTGSVGERQVAATQTLKSKVAPLFPDDAWGQSRFLYWLSSRAAEHSLSLDELDDDIDDDPIGTAAEELLLDRSFLDDVHGLLADHRQLIFYGPPGTGKTYVAQRLAEAIAPGVEQRMLIQFHPSTSYEDFFEGYRPITTSDEQIVYKLVPGPLRIMAERAAQDLSKRPHVLIIDEINRANLAKVLGELLFLLEYRDREIQPLYRPGEPFSLPENLWVIGTMNTADRSIATVDAAMRRRFHFVPFVPDDKADNPLSGLLTRWLDENDEPAEVADLVDGVNQHLRGEMGGDHLLIGPSYFMTKGLGRERLETIWRYRIEPLIDDLFFGDARAKKFHFDTVWKEFGFGDNGPEPDHEPTTAPSDS